MLKPHADPLVTKRGKPLRRPVIMDFVNTALVVAIVATLMLLGIGIVVNQLLRLRKWLNESSSDKAPDEEARQPPE
jgi:hypothetical protein